MDLHDVLVSLGLFPQEMQFPVEPVSLVSSGSSTAEVVVILIWGSKSYVQLLGIVTFVCGNCHNPAAQRVVERIRKFTFFWIPLFTVKRQTLVTCTFCGTASVLNKEQSAALLSQAMPSPAAQTSAPNELPATGNTEH